MIEYIFKRLLLELVNPHHATDDKLANISALSPLECYVSVINMTSSAHFMTCQLETAQYRNFRRQSNFDFKKTEHLGLASFYTANAKTQA